MPVAPEYMQSNAKRGLEWHEDGHSGDGVKPETIRRANAIADGENLTDEHIKEMAAWFARHESSIEGVELDSENPTPGWVAWFLWGGDETNRAQEWSASYVASLEEDESEGGDQREGGHKDDERSLVNSRFVGASERDGVFFRHYSIDPASLATGKRQELIASTDRAVDMGGFREVLSHEEGAIDYSAARSLLYNHNADWLLGGVDNHRIAGGELRSDFEIMADARLPSGVMAQEAVDRGYLRGVSIGYTYRSEDCVYDEREKTLYVKKWRLLEETLTPIPADKAAGVRSFPVSAEQTPDSLAERKAAMSDDKHNEPVQPGPDLAAIEKEAREAANKETKECIAFARSYGVDADEVIGKTLAEVKDICLERARKELEKKVPEPESRVTGSVAIVEDESDKAARAAEEFILHRTGFGKAQNGNPLHGRSYREAAVRWAELRGCRNARDWSKADQAAFALGSYRNMSATARRDAANITSDMFSSFVTLDAITKVVAAGFEQGGRAINYQLFTERQTVPDFKSFNIGSLGTGNLVETVENASFPELAKAEGVYNSEVKMWGGTLSLTIQALINDDTNEFDRSLRQAGAIAQKTINKRVYQKLLMGTSSDTGTSTWTANTTTGNIQYTTSDGAYGARSALDGVIAALMTKVGQDGNPLGTVPAFLLCAPSLAGQARGITGGVAPGQVTMQETAAGDLAVIASPWLATGSGLTGADSAHYYLLADPAEVTGLIVSEIAGMTSPQVMEYDAGANAARKYKIYHAFEADLINQANSAGTSIIAAAQQGVD